MTPQLERAKDALNKHFRFTQMESDRAKSEGKVLMELEDMEYILNFKDLIQQKEVSCLKIKKGVNTPDEVMAMIENAYQQGFKVVVFSTIIPDSVHDTCRKKGYFIEMEGYCEYASDEVYLSEEYFLKNKVRKFQNMFSGFASVPY